MLFDKRIEFKPFEYQWAYDYWFNQQNAHWLHTEINMQSDIIDWERNLTFQEKNVIGKILKGFAQTETHVEDYWTNKVTSWFPKPEIKMMATSFGSFECFDKETELLTINGWMKVSKIKYDTEVAQYDINNQLISFIKPKKITSYHYTGHLHHYIGKATDIMVTPNHDLIVINPRTKKIQKKKSLEGKYGKNYLYPSAGNGIGDNNNLNTFEKLLIAIQADGSIFGLCKSGLNISDVTIILKKKRKINKLIDLLNNCNINYHHSQIKDEFEKFNFKLPENFNINIIKNMDFIDLKSLNQNKAFEIINEVLFWDGTQNRAYYNTNKNAIDKVQAIATLANLRSTIGINRNVKKSLKVILPNGEHPKTDKTCYVLHISSNPNKYYPYKEKVYYDDKVYCVSVDTENLISRRNGKIAIIGNTIHATAYSYLNDTLGLDNFKAFLDDKETMDKLDVLININDTNQNSKEDIAKSIALFSACAEGIQLFSSFAILLSFRKSNRLKGIGQQMIFSIRDESLHSEAGCKLFRQIIKEYPQIWSNKFKKSIYEGVDLALKNEFNFIDKVFENGDLETITKDQLKNFMKHRANRKLNELQLNDKYIIDENLYEEMKWFYHLVSGEIQTDFFSNRETGYSKPNEDWVQDELF